MKAITIGILAGIGISAFIFMNLFTSVTGSATRGEYDAFAQCLTDRGVIMYGAYWCPHCQNEKKAFGDSFRFVNYVECTQETGKCLVEKINGYPTWIFPTSSADGPDGGRFEGEMGLEKLSEASGCLLEDKK